MRQVVLDTETTGLSWERGNRIVEIGCVELVERRPTGRTFQCYINPQCPFEAGAQEITGLTLEFLADKPTFAEIATEFLEFIRDAELVIHNAAFDLGFIQSELSRLEVDCAKWREQIMILDSLELARQRYPGQRNSLDALCKRLAIDHSRRQFHGALLDAQLLADVYLAMTAGQGEIGFGDMQTSVTVSFESSGVTSAQPRPRIVVSAEELIAHAARIETIRSRANVCVWDLEPSEAGSMISARIA